MVIDTLTRRSAQVILDAALVEDGIDTPPSRLIDAALSGHSGAARIDIGLAMPLVGLGASAPTYYPAIAKALGTICMVPDHAGVANAVGAVAGQVSIEQSIRITSPSEGRYRAHLSQDATDFASLDAARDAARADLDDTIRTAAQAAGAAETEIVFDYTESAPMIEGRALFIEATLTARATGRPALASPD